MPYRSLAFVGMLLAAQVCALGQAQVVAELADPKLLFDPQAPDAAAQIRLNDRSEGDVTYTVNKQGIEVTVQPNSKTSFPGIFITPKKPWDATGYGHVEAKITNTGSKRIRVTMSIQNEGTWPEDHTSANIVSVNPGQSAVISTIFGYQYGKAAWALKPEALVRALIFSTKSDVTQTYCIELFQAAGQAGEKPFVDPRSVAVKPDGGVLLGKTATVDAAKQITAKAGAKAGMGADGKSLQIAFTGNNQAVDFKPAIGMWNLRDHLQLRLTIKNIGKSAITPSVQLTGKGGSGAPVAAARPIAPGTTADLVVPFAAPQPWEGVDDPQMKVLEFMKEWQDNKPGTGTKYTSNTTTSVTILPGSESGEMLITAIVAEMPPLPKLPEWLGQRPPVDGAWTKTFEDNFDGSSIDLKKWSIYTVGEYHGGSRTHYTKDNVIVKDGKLTLRIDKKHGHHNDDPTMTANDYAAGYADTYGKWTQRYGYFETRMKTPTAPCVQFSFWTMPDRGINVGTGPTAEAQGWVRANTKEGGMEFDIMEGLTIWGPNRHDVGMHWDSYMKYHKSTGTFCVYIQPDKEGFVTYGMLWEPGRVIMYDNGVEVGRWENSRVCSVQSNLILTNVIAGWEAEPQDDKTLPADLVVDYVRAWQRKDLVSPGDGPKSNDGRPQPPEKK